MFSLCFIVLVSCFFKGGGGGVFLLNQNNPNAVLLRVIGKQNEKHDFCKLSKSYVFCKRTLHILFIVYILLFANRSN